MYGQMVSSKSEWLGLQCLQMHPSVTAICTLTRYLVRYSIQLFANAVFNQTFTYQQLQQV